MRLPAIAVLRVGKARTGPGIGAEGISPSKERAHGAGPLILASQYFGS